MKKLAILALATVMSLCACSKGGNDAPKTDEPGTNPEAVEAAAPAAANAGDPAKLLEGVELTEEGLMGIFKDEKTMTPEQLEALLLSYAKCDAKPSKDSVNSARCPASKVMGNVLYATKTKRELDAAKKFEVFYKNLDHENTLVRDAAYKYIDFSASNAGLGSLLAGKGINAGNDSAINAVIAKAKNEKDPLVYKTIFDRLMLVDTMKDNPELVQLVKDGAKHEQPYIRTSIVKHVAANRLQGVEGIPEMILDMCQNDADMSVRATACGRIVDFEVPDYKKVAVDVLKDANLASGHGKLAATLLNKAIDYPKYQNVDDECMKIYVDYLKVTPRGQDMPAWTGIVELIHRKKDTKFDATIAKLPSYKADEIVKACQDVITDSNAVFLSRTNCADLIVAIGSIDDLKAVVDPLTKSVESGNDKDGTATLKSINDKIAKAAK